MLEDVYKTLSVIVDGPEKEEDEQVLDLVLFDTMDAFDEAVSELIMRGDDHDRNNFLRLCICVDTIIRYRFDPIAEEEIGTPKNWIETLRSIDGTFSVSDDQYGINITYASAGDRNRTGLSGRFVSVYNELGDLEQDNLSELVELMLEMCRDCPSTTHVWWPDALLSIYKYEEHVKSENDEWFTDHNDTFEDTISLWYLKLSKSLGKYYDIYSNIIQNSGIQSLESIIVDAITDDLRNVVDSYGSAGYIVEKPPALLDVVEATTIEDLVISLARLATE